MGMDETIEIRLHKKTARFIYNLLNSSNNVIYNFIKHFMFNNNYMLSENIRYLCYCYKLTVFHWHVNVDVIIKRI